MDELTQYAHDLLATKCKNLVLIPPVDGSLSFNQIQCLQSFIYSLEPSVNFTIRSPEWLTTPAQRCIASN